jgi:hypothetical protein
VVSWSAKNSVFLDFSYLPDKLALMDAVLGWRTPWTLCCFVSAQEALSLTLRATNILRIFIILRSFVPLLRIAYFLLQLFGIKMGLIESLAGGVRYFVIAHRGCLWPCRRLLSLPQPWRAIL